MKTSMDQIATKTMKATSLMKADIAIASFKGPPGRAYGARSFKGSSSDGGRAYYGAKAFKEDGPYYASG